MIFYFRRAKPCLEQPAKDSRAVGVGQYSFLFWFLRNINWMVIDDAINSSKFIENLFLYIFRYFQSPC